MVHHKNQILDANEDFVMFSISKLITWFIDRGVTLEYIPNKFFIH